MTVAPVAMKKFLRVSVLIGCVLCMLLLCGAAALAEADPVSARAECSPDTLSGPYTVKVSIQVANVGDDDLPGAVTLYDPNGNVVSSFGSGGSTTLPIGQSYAWQGEWSVTTEQLDAGRISYKLSYDVFDDAGNRTTKTKNVNATIRKKAPEPNIHIKRQVVPENPIVGQTVTVDYIIANTGSIALENIDIVDTGLGVESGSLTVAKLAVGEQITRSYSFTMGETAVVSDTVCYFFVEGDAKSKYKAENSSKFTITPAQVSITATLTASKQLVNKGDKVELTCVITNQGDLSYEKIKIDDLTLGNVANSITVGAKKTFTEKKTIMVNTSTTLCFEITGTDTSGNPLTIKTNEVTIQTVEDAKPVSLEVNIVGDRDIIYEERVAGTFIIEVRNTGEDAIKDIEIYAGTVKVKTIPSLAAGEEYIFAKEFTLSMGGQYQFTAKAKDVGGNEQTFESNIHQIVYQAPVPTPSPTPTLTPTPSPTPTAEPTMPVTTEDEESSGGNMGTFLLYIAIGLLVIIVGGVAAMLYLDRRKDSGGGPGGRGPSSGKSVEVIDRIERSPRRDYGRASTPPRKPRSQRPQATKAKAPEPKAEEKPAPTRRPATETPKAPERVFAPLDIDQDQPPEQSWDREEIMEPALPDYTEPDDSHRVAPERYQRPQDPEDLYAPEEDTAMRSGSDGQYHLSRRAGSMRPKVETPQLEAEDPDSFARRQRARRGRDMNLAQFYDEDEVDGGATDIPRRKRRSEQHNEE